MPLTLSIGVYDLPYSTPPAADGKEAKPTSATTGDVAGYIENKYGLFAKFYEFSQDKIANFMADSLAGALESAAMGAPDVDPFAAADAAIAAEFRQFLALDTIATLGVPGVPTKAALDGVNHRMKTKKGVGRPNFVDTGTLAASITAWTDKS